MSNGTINQQDLMDRLDKFHDEVVAFAEKTTSNIHTLKAATDIVEAQKDTWWSKFKNLLPLLLVIVAILGLFAMKPAGICTFSFSTEKGVSIEACKEQP